MDDQKNVVSFYFQIYTNKYFVFLMLINFQ